MAKRTIVELIDDLDESAADETVTFGLDGVDYTIDLSSKNAGKLRDALAKFVAAGTKVAKGRSGQAGIRGHVVRTGAKTAAEEKSRNERGQIRSWFEKLTPAQRAAIHPKGATELAERGRIPQAIVDEYNATSGGKGEPKPAPVKPASTAQFSEADKAVVRDISDQLNTKAQEVVRAATKRTAAASKATKATTAKATTATRATATTPRKRTTKATP